MSRCLHLHEVAANATKSPLSDADYKTSIHCYGFLLSQYRINMDPVE